MKSLKNQLFLIVFTFLISSCSPNNTYDYDNVSQNTQTGISASVSEIINDENIEDSTAIIDEENIGTKNDPEDELINDQDGWMDLDLVLEDYLILNENEKHIYAIAKNNTDKLLYAPNITLNIIDYDTNGNNKVIHTGSHNYILPNGYLILDFEVNSDIAFPWWNGTYQIEKIIALDYQQLVDDGFFLDRVNRDVLGSTEPLQVTNFWLEDEYILNIECTNISNETISFDSYYYYVAFFDRFDNLSIDNRYNYFSSCKELAPGETIIIEGRWASEKNTNKAFPQYLPEDAIMNIYFSPVEVSLCINN